MRSGLVCGMAMVVAIGGCGSSAATQDERPATQRPAPPRHPESTPQKRPAVNRPKIDQVQSEARDLCSVFSQAQLAQEYGVPNNLSSVVAAFADGYSPALQINAEEGCLEGLTR